MIALTLASVGDTSWLAGEGAWGQVAALVVTLLALSFFFSGTETAFFSLQTVTRRRIAASEERTDRRIQQLLDEGPSLITTILMGNETVNITVSAIGAALVAYFAPDAPWLTILVVTPILVLFSEITPKVLAFRVNYTWARFAVWPLSVLYVVAAPLRWLFTGVVRLLARTLGVTRDRHESPLQEEEFLVLVAEGEKAGVVDEVEREIIEAVFEFDDLPVERLMTPRPDIFSVQVDIGWDELMRLCREHRFSRVPVYETTRDNIVGVLLVRDLLRHRHRPIRDTDELRQLLVPPVFAPASKPADEMMRDLIRCKSHMAFVADEFGTLMGLLTLDDLIGEIVGDLGDEHREDTLEIDKTEDVMTVRAAVDLDDFESETGIELPEGDYHTLGGFLFHRLGRLPKQGDAIEAADHRFIVHAMDGRRVSSVQVMPLTPATTTQEEVPS